MFTVSPDPVVVESQLLAGGLACPGCCQPVGPWGWARRRKVRGEAGDVWVRPRRGRCGGCGATHVLLPATLLLRRADEVEVIGRALVLSVVAGWGCGRVAGRVGRPRSTVRGWLSRLAGRAEVVRAHFTRWALWLQPAWTRLQPQGCPAADALAALLAAGQAAGDRLGVVGVWRFAATATGGRLLCNTSAPFPGPWIS